MTLDESLIVSDKLIVDHNLMHLNVDNLQIIYENNLKRYDFFLYEKTRFCNKAQYYSSFFRSRVVQNIYFSLNNLVLTKFD